MLHLKTLASLFCDEPPAFIQSSYTSVVTMDLVVLLRIESLTFRHYMVLRINIQAEIHFSPNSIQRPMNLLPVGFLFTAKVLLAGSDNVVIQLLS